MGIDPVHSNAFYLYSSVGVYLIKFKLFIIGAAAEMAVFNVPSIVISKENESGDDDPPEPLITISSSNKKVGVHETSNEEKKEESPNQQSVEHSEHRRPSLKRVSDVLFLAKEWKMKVKDKQERRESLKTKDDTAKEHQVEHEPVPISSALPKETLDEIVEEALSIVIETRQKYKHHLGSNHPLTIKAMKKANDICAQQQKEPMYDIKE
ncbi:PREDICTED: uncharacterized protein LOC109581150 [Amphimedon queenslandica]|uniref:Uncharacterized protein n=1 Tax=Amphimedon queenslandica TaxID=400682 RepID=A0AAN0J0J2_AMPQE|nr:PREDICTED: uncharacterized protein LOC109581150 [Amphimedon queenslandica]|eukprot:XP_019850540.1 PREDICTED: uncharacterized protein LOC109581150 [Amphimedon queenslandica]